MLSVLLSSIAIFLFGAFWFTVLFGKIWAKLMDFNPASDEVAKKMGMMKPLIANFLLNVLVATVLYYLFPNLLAINFLDLSKVLFVIWLGFSFPIYANSAVWERKSWKLVVLNSAHSLLSLLIVSSIIYYLQ